MPFASAYMRALDRDDSDTLDLIVRDSESDPTGGSSGTSQVS